MNVLYGLTSPDAGEIRFDGKPRPHRGRRATPSTPGIGMVHQHFMLIPVMTVAENIVLASEPRERAAARLREGAASACATCRTATAWRSTPTRASRRSASAQQQRVEILKALYRNARLLILDEPTAVLTPQETHELFRVLIALAQGAGHVRSSSSPTSWARCSRWPTGSRCSGAGRPSAPSPAAGTSERELAELMVGRPVLLRVEKEPQPARRAAPCSRSRPRRARQPRARGRARSRRSRCGRARSSGIAGVDGNGQSRAGRGDHRPREPTAGSIVAEGHEIAGHGARASFEAGVGHIPEDRHRRGLVLDFTLAENLGAARRPPAARLALRHPRARARSPSARARLLERVRRPRRRARARSRGPSRAGTSRRS